MTRRKTTERKMVKMERVQVQTFHKGKGGVKWATKKAPKKVSPDKDKHRMLEVLLKFPVAKSLTCKTVEDEIRDNADTIVHWMMPCSADPKLYGSLRAIDVKDSGAR